ncbi:MAG: aminopeptidase P family N-terminal domain-containing protein, partial [Clostridiaceae bacterium]
MLVDEKLKLLREEMKNKGIDAYIIPSSDAHQSEYVAEHWKSRAWISGFTGSAGIVVVTMEESGLWTDGRYFIQAEKQLEDSEIKLFKMKQPNVPTYIEWLQSTLIEGACVGFHSKVFPWAQVKELEKSFEQKEIRINGEFDLIDAIWKERPDIPVSEVYIHDTKYAGKSVKEKLDLVRVEMKKKGAQCYLLSSLDDIAWLFNIRGNDVKNNPVVISYALVLGEKAVLFVDDRKITEEVREMLEGNGVEIRGYHEIEEVL